MIKTGKFVAACAVVSLLLLSAQAKAVNVALNSVLDVPVGTPFNISLSLDEFPLDSGLFSMDAGIVFDNTHLNFLGVAAGTGLSDSDVWYPTFPLADMVSESAPGNIAIHFFADAKISTVPAGELLLLQFLATTDNTSSLILSVDNILEGSASVDGVQHGSVSSINAVPLPASLFLAGLAFSSLYGFGARRRVALK